jgi:hypothetical protein
MWLNNVDKLLAEFFKDREKQRKNHYRESHENYRNFLAELGERGALLDDKPQFEEDVFKVNSRMTRMYGGKWAGLSFLIDDESAVPLASLPKAFKDIRQSDIFSKSEKCQLYVAFATKELVQDALWLGLAYGAYKAYEFFAPFYQFIQNSAK